MTERKKTKQKINKNVLALGFVSFFNDVSSEMIYPLIPIFLASVLGASTILIGLIEGLAESVSSLWKLISGYYSDRVRKRKALVNIGYSLSSLARPLISLTSSAWQVLFIRMADRVGKGIRTSPRDALIADSTVQSYRGTAFGFHRAMDHLGAVVGPLIALILLPLLNQNLRLMFFLSSIPALICLLILFLFVKEKKQSQDRKEKYIKLSLKPFGARFRFYLLVLFIFTLSNSSDAFLILRANNLGVATTLIPLLWIILHLVKSILSTPGGMLSDRYGRLKILIAGFVIYSFVYFGLAFANFSYQVWVLFAVYGIYFSLTEGTEKALVSDLVKVEHRGTAFGLYHFTVGITIFPASLIFGFIWNYFNPTYAFLFGAFLSSIAVLLLLQIKRFSV